jgi:UDP-N-acetyl-D-glucosamine dehydrogenase
VQWSCAETAWIKHSSLAARREVGYCIGRVGLAFEVPNEVVPMLLRSERKTHREPEVVEPYDYRELLAQVEGRKATVGIIGLGYVGLPLGLAAARAGVAAKGFDLDKTKVATLAQGKSYIRHIPTEAVSEAVSSGRFSATTDFALLSDMDVIVVCVPTPITKNCSPDISYILRAGETIRNNLRRGQLIILESTTYPGTTMGELRALLEQTGLKAGRDFFLAFSPEREDPGNQRFTTVHIPKIVGGDGPEATAVAESLYRSFGIRTVTVSSPDTAEAVKLTENVFRAVNIAMVNELKVVFGRMGIDIWEVIQAADTKPFGFMAFYPGPGVGGHCIPADPYFLTARAREFNMSARLTEIACEINRTMPEQVVDGIGKTLDVRFNRGLSGSKVLVLGAAYKKNVDDMRDSPALHLIDILLNRGSQVDYHDTFVPVLPRLHEFPDLEGRQSVPFDVRSLATYHAVVVATDHDGVDYEAVANHARLVIDTRNVFARHGLTSDNIVKL